MPLATLVVSGTTPLPPVPTAFPQSDGAQGRGVECSDATAEDCGSEYPPAVRSEGIGVEQAIATVHRPHRRNDRLDVRGQLIPRRRTEGVGDGKAC